MMEDFPPLSSSIRSGHPPKVAWGGKKEAGQSDSTSTKPASTPWCQVVKKNTPPQGSPFPRSSLRAAAAATAGVIDPLTGFEIAEAPGSIHPPTPSPTNLPPPTTPCSARPPVADVEPAETATTHPRDAQSAASATQAGKISPADVSNAQGEGTRQGDEGKGQNGGNDVAGRAPAAEEVKREGLSMITSTGSEDSSSLLGSAPSSEGGVSTESSRSTSPLCRSEVQVAPGVIIRDWGPKRPGEHGRAPFFSGGRNLPAGHGPYGSRGFQDQRFHGRGFGYQQRGASWQEERVGGQFNQGSKSFNRNFQHPNFNQGHSFNRRTDHNQWLQRNNQHMPALTSDTWSRHSKGSNSSGGSLSSQGSLTSAANHHDVTQPQPQRSCHWYGDIQHRLADVSEWLWATPDQRSEAQQRPTLLAVPVMVPGPDGEVQYVPWIPWDPAALIKAALQHQIEYYFSEQNLWKDVFLRSQMDREGYVKVSVISNFNKVKCFLVDESFILDAVRSSEAVEVHGDGIRRRHGWQLWLPEQRQFCAEQLSVGGEASNVEDRDGQDGAIESGGCEEESSRDEKLESKRCVERDAANMEYGKTTN